MQLAPVTSHLIGRHLKDAVYTEQGSLLIPQGALISNAILTRLLNHNIDEVSIIETFLNLDNSEVQTTPIPDKTYDFAVRVVKDVFDEVLKTEALGIKALVPPSQLELVLSVADQLLEVLEQNPDLLFAVVDLIEADAYTHRHNVNVAVLSILTAKHMNYKPIHLRDIALGALLHDIGKAKVEPLVLQKPEVLTDLEKACVMAHPTLGHEIVMNCEALPYLSKQIILLHHEKLDGSGYPLGLKSIEIPEYVQIVTVCDMYDAMTTNRIYRQKMPAYQAIDILLAECVYKINPHILSSMLHSVWLFPPGSGVVLSDGRIGVVSYYKAINPSRPRVRILNFEGDFIPTDIQEVNLEEVPTLFVEDTWDVDMVRDILRSKNSMSQLILKQRSI